jgi:transcriptional/translational regulatory protein YebC/TACO1
MFAKSGGQLAGSGAVAWQYAPRAQRAAARDASLHAAPDALAANAAGAHDVDR